MEEERHGYFDDSFEMLHNYVGQTVYCVWNNKGYRAGLKGILSNVVPYDIVSIEGKIIPFVDPLSAIEGIFTEDKEPIFRNYKAGEYRGCSMYSPSALAKEQAELLGYSVVSEGLNSESRHTGR